jgi:hypothetical protein
MTTPRRTAGFRLALSACILPTIFASNAPAKGVAPFRAELAVRWGAGAGSDAFTEDLTRSMAEGLATGCFSSVVIADARQREEDSDLILTVVLSDTVDETRFDDPIAGVLQPGEPAKELRRVAVLAVTVDATLSARVNGAVVCQKHFVVSVSKRPVYLGEDPQETARRQAIESAVRQVKKMLGCGDAKLERKIRDALSARGLAPPQAR